MDLRKEAYKIISKVLIKNYFSDKLLDQMSKKLKSAGENADLFYFLVKGVIKMQKNLDYIATFHTDKNKFSKTDSRIKYLIYLGIYQLRFADSIPEHAAVNETVKLAKSFFSATIANFINAVLRSYLRNPNVKYPENTAERLAFQYSFSLPMIEKWIEYWGAEKTEKLCVYYNSVPKLHIRINEIQTTKKELLNYFQTENINCEESDAIESIIYSDDARKILNDPLFRKGLYSIQDASSALVVKLLSPQKDESILDLFAAPGGKTTYISEIMKNTGEVIAVDKFPHKIKIMKKTLKRLDISNVSLKPIDAFQFGPVAPAFDRVLLDVPCSGWGVFQKKAELRWQKNQDIEQLLKLQTKVLKHGAKFVKPDGYLVYSTCTLNKQENENMINNFLQHNKNFKLASAENYVKKEFTENGFLKTLPFKHKMDGTFAAKLQRIE